MPKGRISKRSVDALVCPPGKDRVLLWDNSLAGFGVAAFPGGKKVYVAQYRQGGRSRRATIGEHGRLAPDEARSEAKKLLGAVESGVDPIAARRAGLEIPTFQEAAEAYLTRHVAARRKPRTISDYARLLHLHILPAIGALRVTEIRRAHISKMHTAIVSPGAANRALTLAKAILNWTAAERDDLALPANATRGLRPNPEHARERFLTSDEFSRLGDALRLSETEGLPFDVDESNPKAKHAPKPWRRRVVLNPFSIAALRLLVFTGARRGEILSAKWGQIDFERAILFLPDSKTGRKPIYLNAPALEVLAGLPRIEGNPYLIAGRGNGTPRADLKRPWMAICKAAGLTGVRS